MIQKVKDILNLIVLISFAVFLIVFVGWGCYYVPLFLGIPLFVAAASVIVLVAIHVYERSK